MEPIEYREIAELLASDYSDDTCPQCGGEGKVWIVENRPDPRDREQPAERTEDCPLCEGAGTVDQLTDVVYDLIEAREEMRALRAAADAAEGE